LVNLTIHGGYGKAPEFTFEDRSRSFSLWLSARTPVGEKTRERGSELRKWGIHLKPAMNDGPNS